MIFINKVSLLGRITKEPEFKVTPNCVSVCTFTLAVNRKFTKDKADFINIVTWRSTADFVHKYFTKGLQIALTGGIQVRSWQDKDGKTHYATEVVADEVFFADSKKDTSSATDYMSNTQSDFEEIEPEDGELPF